MKHPAAIGLFAMIVATGCTREKEIVIAPPVTPPATTSSSSTTTVTPPVETSVSSAPASVGAVSAAASGTSVTPTEATTRLQTAADRLRGAVQAMANEAAGPRRNDAIKQANEALLEVNQAMISLPPDMRFDASTATGTTSGIGASGAAGGVVYPSSDAEYSKAVERLMKAAQQLRESIQTMAQEQPGSRRDDAIKAAHKALYDTQQAMIQLPPDARVK